MLKFVVEDQKKPPTIRSDSVGTFHFLDLEGDSPQLAQSRPFASRKDSKGLRCLEFYRWIATQGTFIGRFV